MTLEQLKMRLEEFYVKGGQTLYLLGFIDEADCRERGNFTEQDIDLVDGKHQYGFITIQTYSNLQPEDASILGSIPYCINEGGIIHITVPKFGELEKEDIHKAIRYVIRKLLVCFIFNVEYEGERVPLYEEN